MAASFCIILLFYSSSRDRILFLLVLVIVRENYFLLPRSETVFSTSLKFLISSSLWDDLFFFSLSHIQELMYFLFYIRWHFKTLCHLALPMSQVLIQSCYPSIKGSITLIAYNFMLASGFFAMSPCKIFFTYHFSI